MEHLTCAVCASPIVRAATGPAPTYCSRSCRSRAHYVRRVAPMEAMRRAAVREAAACQYAGCEVPVVRNGARGRLPKWCEAHRVAIRSAQPKDSLSKKCEVDGCDRPLRARRMCSMHWRRDARARGAEKNPVWDGRRRTNWLKRQALIEAGEDVALSDVAARDGGVCQLCDNAVDLDLAWPDPMSKSLDHIVPLSRGGAHSFDNSQLAHLFCNTSKGARVA